MKVAYILFDDMTLLDFVGVYDPLSRLKSMNLLKGYQSDLCALTPTVKDNFDLEITIDKIKPDLSDYDMIIIPGGLGTRKLQFNTTFINWIKTAKNIEYKVAVCTGSLILGAAGFLNNKMATTHFNEYQTLKNYCNNVIENRIVDDSNTITAGAVSSSLDLGLYLCKKLVGNLSSENIRKSMDYSVTDFEIVSK